MARSPARSDVFSAVAEARRREILDALVGGEMGVGELVGRMGMAQPQVSKHLRVLSDVGLVTCRVEGRRHLYRVNHAPLRDLAGWLDKYQRAWTERLDRLDDYLIELLREDSDT